MVTPSGYSSWLCLPNAHLILAQHQEFLHVGPGHPSKLRTSKPVSALNYSWRSPLNFSCGAKMDKAQGHLASRVGVPRLHT